MNVKEEGVHLQMHASVIEYWKFYMCITVNMNF